MAAAATCSSRAASTYDSSRILRSLSAEVPAVSPASRATRSYSSRSGPSPRTSSAARRESLPSSAQRSRAAASAAEASRSSRSAASYAVRAASTAAAWAFGGGPGLRLGQAVGHRRRLGLPGVDEPLEFTLLGIGEKGLGRGLRGVEPGPERGVREPVVGLLAVLCGRLLLTYRLCGRGEQPDPALQQRGVLGHTARLAAGDRQFGFQRGLFAVQPFAQGGAGRGPALGQL